MYQKKYRHNPNNLKENESYGSSNGKDDVIIRYEKGEVIGITILNASKRILNNSR